ACALGLFYVSLCREMAMVSLVDQQRGSIRFLYGPLDLASACVVHFDAFAVEHRPVAFFQVADRVGERRQRDSIRTEIHFAIPVADGQWRTLARADQQIVLSLEQERECE